MEGAFIKLLIILNQGEEASKSTAKMHNQKNKHIRCRWQNSLTQHQHHLMEIYTYLQGIR